MYNYENLINKNNIIINFFLNNKKKLNNTIFLNNIKYIIDKNSILEKNLKLNLNKFNILLIKQNQKVDINYIYLFMNNLLLLYLNKYITLKEFINSITKIKKDELSSIVKPSLEYSLVPNIINDLDLILNQIDFKTFLKQESTFNFKSFLNQESPQLTEYSNNSLLEIIESYNNFGHNDIVIQGDIEFPKSTTNQKDIHLPKSTTNQEDIHLPKSLTSSAYINNQDFLQNKDELNSHNINSNIYFDKQEYLKDKILNYKKDYFKLYKYVINFGNNNNLIIRDGPMLILSLFMPNDILYNKQYSGWTKKYFKTQIQCILVFKYYFPNCNIRLYFDWFLLEKGFKMLKGDDESLILTKQFDKFKYNDFEEGYQTNMRIYLNNFYNILKKYEDFPFKNGMERFLFYYHLASKSRNNNLQVEVDDIPGEFFIYKFDGPFIENKGTSTEGHITNGYIGQQLRYITLKQTDYIFNDKLIKRPKHLVYRDAHANCPAYNDFLWIKYMNDISNGYQKEFYLIPSSLGYITGWNDKVKCNIDGKIYPRSAVAGIVQFVNSTNSEHFITDDTYKRSIGITFLLNKNNELPILTHRDISSHEPRRNFYGYGIDEYINSSFFNLDSIKKKSIYFSHYYADQILHEYFLIIELFLIKFLFKTQTFTQISKIDFLKKVEILRNDYKLHNNNELGLLLSIYPTKYHIVPAIFNNDYDDIFYNKPLVNINTLFEKFINKYGEDKLKYLDELTFNNLKEFNITCISSAISTSSEWCLNPYQENKNNILKCPPSNFYSGFYYELSPSLNHGIIRQPSELYEALIQLEKNNLIIPLNNTDYKLYIEKNNFMNDILKNIINKKCKIKKHLQKIILSYNYHIYNYDLIFIDNILKDILNLKEKLINKSDDIEEILIFKALNYYGYDINPECIYINFINNVDYISFNNNVKKLANIPGWAVFAANILLYDNDNYDNYDNYDKKTYLKKIKEKSSKYSQMKDNNHSLYKMAT